MLQEQIGYEIAAESEEHPDAQETALRPADVQVISDHGQHGYGPQAVQTRNVPVPGFGRPRQFAPLRAARAAPVEVSLRDLHPRPLRPPGACPNPGQPTRRQGYQAGWGGISSNSVPVTVRQPLLGEPDLAGGLLAQLPLSPSGGA